MDNPDRPAHANLVRIGLLLVAGALAVTGHRFGGDISAALREGDPGRLDIESNLLWFALIGASVAVGLALAAYGWFGTRVLISTPDSSVGATTSGTSQDPRDTPSNRWVPGLIVGAIAIYVGWESLSMITGFIDAFRPKGSPSQREANRAPVAAPSAKPAPANPPAGSQRPYPAAEHWLPAFQRASGARVAGRTAEAVKEYEAALAIVEQKLGADDPLAAAMLERIGEIHIQARQYAAAEPVLRRSLAILEQHSHAEVGAEAGRLILGFDRESVQRKLAWSLWELRRYPDALAAYQRAYDLVPELRIGEADRNRRLAYSSAGIMAAACTQRDWARADRAMLELKDRIQRVSPGDRQWLEYWVRTGEPRLTSRQC